MNSKLTLIILFTALTLPHFSFAQTFWGKNFKANSSLQPEYRKAVMSRLNETQLRQFGIYNQLMSQRNQTLENKIRWVHAFTQKIIREVNDPNDLWQTPFQTLNHRRGDCEDFALLRIELLRWLGVSSTNQLVFTGWTYGQGHAVAAVSTPDGTWTLDNLRNGPYLSNQPLNFKPTIGMNGKGVWYFAVSK